MNEILDDELSQNPNNGKHYTENVEFQKAKTIHNSHKSDHRFLIGGKKNSTKSLELPAL